MLLARGPSLLASNVSPLGGSSHSPPRSCAAAGALLPSTLSPDARHPGAALPRSKQRSAMEDEGVAANRGGVPIYNLGEEWAQGMQLYDRIREWVCTANAGVE
jgi:hypothetical protein